MANRFNNTQNVPPNDVSSSTITIKKEDDQNKTSRRRTTNLGINAPPGEVRPSQKRELVDEETNGQERRVIPRTNLPFDENESIEKLVKVYTKKDDVATVLAAMTKIGDMLIGPNRETNKVLFVKSGGHIAIVWAMQAFPNSAGIQAVGSFILMDVVTYGNQLSSQVSTVGGFEAILGAMTKFPDTEDIQRLGCGALGNLIFAGLENTNYFMSLNGVSMMVAAMKKFPYHEEVQFWSCNALVYLAGYVHLKHPIEKAGGLEVLGASIKNHPVGSRVYVYAKAAMQRIVN